MEVAALEIVLRTRRAQTQAKKSQASIRGIGTAAKKAQTRVAGSTAAMGGSFARLRRAIFSTQALLLSLGIGIGLVQTIQTLRDFEHTMAGVRAVTGATAKEFILLSDKARKLGATTIFSATEAAEGMRLLGLAGFEVSEALGAIEGTLNLAAAGSLSLGEASQITANIIRSFRLEAEKAVEIADILAKAATNANTTVGGLGNAFSFVGAVARAANQSVADTAATLGVLTDAGFDASRAGTGLRRVLGEILVQNENLLARLPELGLTFEDINLQTNSMVDVFQKLAPLATDAAFALEVFGQRGGPAFLAVVGQADRLDLLAEKTRNAGGTAKEIAGILTDTLFGAFKLMRSALEEATLRVGDMGLTGALRSMADTVTGVVTVLNGMSASLGENAEKFERLTERVKTLGVFLAALALPFIIKGLFVLAAAAGAALAALVALVGIPTIAVAAVVALFYSWRDRLIELGDQTMTFGALLSELFGQTIALLKETVGLFMDMIGVIFNVGNQSEESFGTVMSGAILTIVDLIDRSVRGLRALLIILGDVPHILSNWGEMSDEAFEKLQELENLEPIGDRAAKNYAEGFKKGLDAKALAGFKVAIKDVLKQAEALERRVVSISGLKMTQEQTRELKLLQIEAFEASKGVTELAQEIEALGGAEKLSAEQLGEFDQRLRMAKTGLTEAGRSLLNFQKRLQQVSTSTGSEALDVIEKLNDQLKVLGVFGEEAQFVMQALAEANLDAADATNEHRVKVTRLANAVIQAKKAQEAYQFVVKNSQEPVSDLRDRLGHLDILLRKEAISQQDYARAVGLTKLEIQELNEELRQQDILAASADLSAFEQGLVESSLQMGLTRENMQELGRTATDELGTALTDALRNPAEAGDIFLNALARIGDRIIELAAQELLLRPLMNTLTGINSSTGEAGGGVRGLLGSLGGSGGGGGGLGGLFSSVIGLFGSKGGYVTDLPAGLVPARAFQGARRFQLGGAVDNIPIMANKNEAVVPLGGGRKIPVEMRGGGGPSVVMNITTPDPEAFRRSQGHILSQAAAQLQNASVRNG